jgi:cyclic beta-1,2-glucan synthetase
VRENGGQYTHAAVWAAMAFAALGDAQRAWQVMDLVNPLHHGRTAGEVAVYKVEPYVVAADVYSVAPHTGRGGWTWYTGSAGWMYRLVIESLVGLRLRIDERGAWLAVQPCVPEHWNAYAVDYRFRETEYRIEIELLDEADAVTLIEVDGVPCAGDEVALFDDRQAHQVRVRTARVQPAALDEAAVAA